MSPHKSRRLATLGIESWKLRANDEANAPETAAEEVSAPAFVPLVRSGPRDSPGKVAAPLRKPAAPPVAPPAAAPSREVPEDWEGLAAAVSGCEHCKLCATRNKTVFGVGAHDAPLLIVGEGPGADEDAQGEPFVGRAGKLLDEMLKAIGRSRQAEGAKQAVYIANVVKCRPPGNRDPEADEVSACRPYLDQQIRLLKPRLIVALGRIAAQRLLATDAALSKLRGPLYEYGDLRTPVFVSYHPAYLLRSPGEKAKSWQDLKRVARFLNGGQGPADN